MTDAAHGRRLVYQPALDGLRGLAVGAVLLFHSDLSWARGGYLGVSTFFTLSGFLICSLLLAEARDDGGIDLGAFWGRRFRRLMPAALGGLAAALLYGATVADSTQLAELQGDVLGALAYVANWRFVFADQSYGDLFATPSPVLHFWSLAIEEQFYVVFPLLVAGVVRWRGRGRTDLGVVLLVLIAASVAASVVLVGDGTATDRAYFGTDARAAELLIGALLALWWHHLDDDALQTTSRWTAALAPIALVGLAVCWSVVDQSSAWLHQGGLPLYAVGSAAVIAGAVASSGPVRALLSLEPLRQLGRYSYGVYVYHWPIFLWLTAQRTGLDDAPLLALRTTATAAVAITSFHLLEQPVRNRRVLRGPQARPVAAAAIVAVAIAAAAVTTDAPADVRGLDERAAEAVSDGAPDDGRPRVGVYGDSTAHLLGGGLYRWASIDGRLVPGGSASLYGCGITGATDVQHGGEAQSLAQCADWEDRWSVSTETGGADIIVVSIVHDVKDLRLPGADEHTNLLDPDHRAVLLAEMHRAVDLLAADGAIVLWVRQPHVLWGTVDGVPPSADFPENDPARMDAYNEIVDELARSRPEVTAIDLGGYLQGLPGGEMDPTLRSDLVHLDLRPADAVAAEFLGPAVLDALDAAG